MPDEPAPADTPANGGQPDDDDRAQRLLADAVDADTTDWKAAHDRVLAQSRKWEDRAKANSAAVKELETLRKERMTETERAVAEALQKGRVEASGQFSKRLALAELRAEAAGKVEQPVLDGFLKYADLTRFVNPDTGEPDSKAITAAIGELAPKRPASFDNGARSSPDRQMNMNDVIRRAAGYR